MLDSVSSPITDQRLAMRARGYSPLPLNGKAPKIASWQTRADATEHEIHAWARGRSAETNTGLLTRNHPAFDVDILSSAEVADAVADLIADELRDCGRLMVRFGRKPKRAIVCRTSAPFKKIKVEFDSFFTDPETGEIRHDAIEILGDGQQLACFGEHPDTKQPYEWIGGSPADVPASALPPIGEADAREIVDKVVAMLAERFGIKPRGSEPKAARPDAPIAAAKTTDAATAWGAAALRSACEMIAGAGSGSQEETLNGQCYGVGQLVAGGQLPEGEAISALLAAAAAMPDYDPVRPWGRGELARKVERSFADGKSKPRAAPEDGAEPVPFLLEPTVPLFAIRDTDIDVSVVYAADIAVATELARSEFADIWAEHGERIIQEGKDTLYTLHVYGIVADPLAHFLDGADAFVSREVEGLEKFADRFAPLYGRAHEMEGRETQRLFEAALRAIINDPVYREALLAREDVEAPDPATEAEGEKKRPILPGWMAGAMLNADGWPYQNIYNVLWALRHNPQLRIFSFDEMALKTVVRQKDGTLAPIVDTDTVRVQAYLQKQSKMSSIGGHTVTTAIDAVARENCFHPVRDYLAGLRWDGVPRLDKMLHAISGPPMTPTTPKSDACSSSA
jgi:hypothetical protein